MVFFPADNYMPWWKRKPGKRTTPTTPTTTPATPASTTRLSNLDPASLRHIATLLGPANAARFQATNKRIAAATRGVAQNTKAKRNNNLLATTLLFQQMLFSGWRMAEMLVFENLAVQDGAVPRGLWAGDLRKVRGHPGLYMSPVDAGPPRNRRTMYAVVENYRISATVSLSDLSSATQSVFVDLEVVFFPSPGDFPSRLISVYMDFQTANRDLARLLKVIFAEGAKKALGQANHDDYYHDDDDPADRRNKPYFFTLKVRFHKLGLNRLHKLNPVLPTGLRRAVSVFYDKYKRT